MAWRARVLLVEDEPRVRRVLRLALEDEGYEVVEAATGGPGLHRARRGDPDVVLLDLMLPGHRRLLGLPGDPARRATCRSSW